MSATSIFLMTCSIFCFPSCCCCCCFLVTLKSCQVVRELFFACNSYRTCWHGYVVCRKHKIKLYELVDGPNALPISNVLVSSSKGVLVLVLAVSVVGNSE